MRSSKARGVGKQYWQVLWGFRGPAVEVGWSNETEAPYRYGHCTVRRLLHTPLALVHGRWQGVRPGPQLLHHLLHEREPDYTDDLYVEMLQAALEGKP